MMSCSYNASKIKDLSDYVPASATAVLKIARLEATKEDFRKNSLVTQLKNDPFSGFFKNYHSFFQGFESKDKVLLCLERENDSISQFILIAKKSDFVFNVDSLSGAKTKSYQLEGIPVRSATISENTIYSMAVDSVFLIATSEKLLSDVVLGKVIKNPAFHKAYKVKIDKELTLITKLGNKGGASDIAIPWAEYASFELQLLPGGLVGHGVVVDNDTLPQLISFARGQVPQKTDAPSIIPSMANRATSISFSSSDILESNLKRITGDSLTLNPLFETINEMVEIDIANGHVMALKSLDKNISWENLASDISESASFRDVTLFNLSEEMNYFTPFSPLFQQNSYKVVFEWDEFLFFAENIEQAELVITSLSNESVLSKTSYYENTAAYLAASSSIVYYEMKGKMQGLLSSLLNAQHSTMKGFPIMVTQLIYDRNFAHLNLIAKEVSSGNTSSEVVGQLLSLKLENDIAIPPKFFTNHNTSGKDMVVQDITNSLYFIASNGKILWKKLLDGPIQGTIQEIDILRNGKKQLAFSTSKSFYVLDRNGNPVAPFPKTFKDAITQPVSIFDYDNNRKYRFVIIQNDKVLMYDSEGNIVDGFAFKKTGSNIVLQPQHIRIGNKDFILIAEENGRLHILSRVGKERIAVKKKFSFGAIPIEREGSEFVVITKDHKKESIDLNGKVTTQQLNVSDTYWFTISGSNKVTLDDNLLRINGKLIELPIGIYGKPQLFSVNNQVYVGITEKEEKKVFVFTKSGKLLNNFPVYGTSELDLGDANRNGKLNVLVQGQRNEIILYQNN